MGQGVRQRAGMAALGALAGLSLYLLAKIVDENWLGDRLALALVSFAVVFFAGSLSMAGPVRMARALAMAAGLAAVVALLLSWAGLRYESLNDFQPFPLFAATVLAVLPLPFLMAQAGPGWRDYPSLFTQSWGLFVRLSLAVIFVGVVWGVILLSDALFGLIGLRWIEQALEMPVVPWLITGMVFGLALAVVNELSDYVSPFLILRLLRLLVLPVLVVLVVFGLALPLRGLGGLFGGLSSAATLLAMVAAAVTLVSAAVDQADAEAVGPGLRARAVQALALLVPVPAGLAAVSLWLRVGQYGWTPGRLFAAWMVVLALGYGVFYALAVLRPGSQVGWQAAVRRANIGLALAMIGSAALWLTPLLHPEAIAARSQLARFEAGGRNAEDVDIYALSQWGRAGARALDALEEIAAEPGQTALAARLKGEQQANAPMDPVALRAALLPILALQPSDATATRDAILAAADPSLLNYWRSSCERVMPEGHRGCVMVVADLWTDLPGAEALMVTADEGGFLNYNGLVLTADGLQSHAVQDRDGFLPDQGEGSDVLVALQAAPPVLEPAPLHQIRVGAARLLMLP